MGIPVFHDDQHGTAVVVSAAIQNALIIAGKDIAEVRLVGRRRLTPVETRVESAWCYL